MLNRRLADTKWTEYKGSALRFEPEIGLVLIRRGSRVYLAKTFGDAHIVAKFLQIQGDPEIVALRQAISEGATYAVAAARASSTSKH